MNGRTIRNLAGAALMALGLFGGFFALFLLAGPGAVALNGGLSTLMLLQTQALIISATAFLAGLVLVCTGQRRDR